MTARSFGLPAQPFKLRSYIKRYSAKFWIQAVGGILYNTVIVTGPILIGKVIDAATDIETLGYTDGRMRALALYAALFVVATAVFQLARLVKRWWLRDMFNRVANDLRAGLLAAVMDRSMPEVERESVGDLMARTVGDVNQVVDTVQYTINETWDTWLLMVSYFCVLMIYNWRITLIGTVPVIAALFVAESLRHPLYRLSLNARQAASMVSSHLQRTLNGISILRLFGREEAENQLLEGASKEQTRWNIRTSLLQTGIMPVYASLASLGVIGVIVWGGREVMSGAWTLGRFSAYLTMFLAMAVRTRIAANVINRFHAAQAAWDRVKEKMAQDINEDEASPTMQAAPLENVISAPADARVTIADMSFRFGGATVDTLSGISCAIEPGAVVAITGPVGSGKSAMATVLTGLYPYQGSITIGGAELSLLSPGQRRATVAYSGQDSFIFSSSIRHNITLQHAADNQVDQERLQRALYISALGDDLEVFADGLDTIVGERGVRVSGGQRQRIALARAIYAETPILVLDDPFSAVDIGTERRMVERIQQELTNTTVFIFSHRLMAFRAADLIMVLEGGQVSEMGAHEALMAQGGTYARIYRAQTWLAHEDEHEEAHP